MQNKLTKQKFAFPLTKTLAEADYAELAEELKEVDAAFDSSAKQWPQRRWEYAMALRAHSVGAAGMASPPAVGIDVGGAGSPFSQMLLNRGLLCAVVDPRARTGELAHWQLSGGLVFCISVIEHVPDLEGFLDDLARVTLPGGICFLTFDIWNQGTEDKAHFHWLRQRIFTPQTWLALADGMQRRDFGLLGGADWDYHGHDLMLGYSFGSLALRKLGGMA